jgi:hypothetical protein
MTRDVALREIRVLLDRYLETSNHYARELRNHLKDYENSPSRLSTLIGRLEAIDESVIDPTRSVDAPALEEQPQGQNIVRTADTLAALRISADEILERLNTPMESVPRNLWWLRNWLKRDALEIAAGLPSFTYAWDKLIDLNRLTLAPDSRFLRVRDTVSLATMEFERFTLALKRLAQLAQNAPSTGAIPNGAAVSINPKDALVSLCTPLVATLDPLFDARVKRVVKLLQRRKDSLEQTLIVRDASRDTDALALVGLELGFTQWLGFASPSKEHRKTIIMSLLVCSKLFLVETSWQNAKEFSGFAIKLTTRMNADLNIDPTEGTAILRFNQFWARYKLGENILEEVEQWDVSELHKRYSFLKSVLLRNFDDAIRFLETLLPRRKSGDAANFSIAEAEEWPILEDFRSSANYQDFKRRLEKQAAE